MGLNRIGQFADSMRDRSQPAEVGDFENSVPTSQHSQQVDTGLTLFQTGDLKAAL